MTPDEDPVLAIAIDIHIYILIFSNAMSRASRTLVVTAPSPTTNSSSTIAVTGMTCYTKKVLMMPKWAAPKSFHRS